MGYQISPADQQELLAIREKYAAQRKRSLAPVSGEGSYREVGNFVTRGANNVDPRMRAILAETARRSGQRVEAFSGYRGASSGEHGGGNATDINLFRPDGTKLPNYQTPESFAAYQSFAHKARAVQQEMYPELNDSFRWGGYFSGAKGKYGALDLMHFDTGEQGRGMLGGNWKDGLNKGQASRWGLRAGLPASADPTNPGGLEAPSTVANAMRSRQRDVLIRTVLGEAIGEDEQGQAVVVSTILNRSRDKGYASDPAKIAMQPGAYSANNAITGYAGGSGANKQGQIFNPGDPQYDRAARVVDGVLSGAIADPTGGATHYYSPAGMPGGRALTGKDKSMQLLAFLRGALGLFVVSGKSANNQVSEADGFRAAGRGVAPATRMTASDEPIPFDQLSVVVQDQVRNGAPVPRRSVMREGPVPKAQNSAEIDLVIQTRARATEDQRKQSNESDKLARAQQDEYDKDQQQQKKQAAFARLADLRNQAAQFNADFTAEMLQNAMSGSGYRPSEYSGYGAFDNFFEQV